MTPDGHQAIFLRDGRQWNRIAVNELLYLEADDNCTTVHTATRDYILSRMLKDVLDGIADPRIVRVHRSHAVNLDRVTAVSDNGLHVGGRWFPIGRSYREEVLARLKLL